MAGHVNGALGLQMAHPDRTVVVGCGDGCYLLSGFELMTAVQYEIPVIWVIFDDEEFKLIKVFQLATYFQTALVEFPNPDFAAYARACGADGYRVESIEEFEDAFAAALASNRPTVLDAKITRWALPHYSPSPKGLVHGLAELLEDRHRGEGVDSRPWMPARATPKPPRIACRSGRRPRSAAVMRPSGSSSSVSRSR